MDTPEKRVWGERRPKDRVSLQIILVFTQTRPVMWSAPPASHWAFIPRMAHSQSFPAFDSSFLLWRTYSFNFFLNLELSEFQFHTQKNQESESGPDS
jgi:hypothetical protein